ncbi:MAG: InlB B-repeat-containing protein [Bifidobacteriaceae bacterium]|jgi:uncharacterized repeat protein (TIGR02543 family)|nr:InlB B-repeat-containing protein [Bifidobacteriaceae bacterium]
MKVKKNYALFALFFLFVAVAFSVTVVSSVNAVAPGITGITVKPATVNGGLDFTLSADGQAKYTIKIVDSAGNVAFQDNNVAKGTVNYNKVRGLSPSSYTVTVTAVNGAQIDTVTHVVNVPVQVKNTDYETKFKDLDGLTEERADSVKWLYKYGITTGLKEDPSKYNPSAAVNRGAMAQFLHRFAGSLPAKAKLPKVSDINKLAKDRQADIKWLAAEKITVLRKGNVYKPNDKVNRGAMAELMWKTAGFPKYTPTEADYAKVNDIDKVESNPNRQKAILWLVNQKVTVLDKKGNFNPNNPVNRGSMAQFMQKLYEKVIVPVAAPKPAENVDVIAQEEKVQDQSFTYVAYKVTFNANGGTTPDRQIVASGKKITNVTSKMVGHGFVGWYTDAALTRQYNVNTAVTGNLTLYAKWDVNLYTVSFNPENGTQATEVQVPYGDVVAEPTPEPTRAGYTFDGWFITKDGIEEVYTFDTPVTGNIELSAHWTIVNYTVSFNPENGTQATEVQVPYGDVVAEPTPEPTRVGYTFDGWFITENGVDKVYTFDTPVTGNIELNAHWTPINLQIASQETTYADKFETLTLTFNEAVEEYVGETTDPFTVTLAQDKKSATVVPKGVLVAGEFVVPELTFTSLANSTTAESEAVILYVVDIEAKRATNEATELSLSAQTGGIRVSHADAEKPFAKISYGNDETKWVHFGVATDLDILQTLRAIYLPNKDVQSGSGGDLANALELFYYIVSADKTATPDIVEMKGEKVPNSGDVNAPLEIHIGIPEASNAGLPDFVIPPAALGDGNTQYQGTRIVVNNGAYLLVDSDQSFNGSDSFTTPTAGKLKNGNVEAKAGGKIRDAAFSDWPLGTNSSFTIRADGYLAVGPGTRDGKFEGRTYSGGNTTYTDPTNDAGCSNLNPPFNSYCPGMAGWLIGPQNDSLSRIELGKVDGKSNTIHVTTNTDKQGWVYLEDGSRAKVVKYANIYPYNVIVGKGSAIEIAAELTTDDGNGTQARFYGNPTSSCTPTGDIPGCFPGSVVKMAQGGSISGAALGTTGTITYDASAYNYVPTASGDAIPSNPWDANTAAFKGTWAVPS